MNTEIIATQTVNTLNLNVDSERLLTLAADFRRFAKKAAEGVLDMAATVLRASKLGSDAQFHRFCELVGQRYQSPTMKKLKLIGEKYEFLLAKAEKLPGSWTTVYQIAKLANDEIERLIDKGVIHAQMLARDLPSDKPSKIKGESAKKAREVPNGTDATPEMGFRVRLVPNLDDTTARKLKSLLSEIKALKEAQVEVGASLETFLAA